jgi:glucose-1-phosphate cytidylyltransferase
MDPELRMKTLILAGGMGTRLAEETEFKPKPMVDVGGRPILWHILKGYAHHGFDDFVLALGYKGEQIKRYITEYSAFGSDLSVNTGTGDISRHSHDGDRWQIDLIDTGLHSETAGRMLRARPHLGDSTFMMTYGDGVADIDLKALLDFHRSHGKLATVTAVHPTARFGQLEFDGDLVATFNEKPQLDSGWINGGFFVLEPDVFDFIPEDCDWSRAPLEALANARQLAAYRHDGFWQCMDTLRDRMYLDSLWDAGNSPWAVWQ